MATGIGRPRLGRRRAAPRDARSSIEPPRIGVSGDGRPGSGRRIAVTPDSADLELTYTGDVLGRRALMGTPRQYWSRGPSPRPRELGGIGRTLRPISFAPGDTVRMYRGDFESGVRVHDLWGARRRDEVRHAALVAEQQREFDFLEQLEREALGVVERFPGAYRQSPREEEDVAERAEEFSQRMRWSLSIPGTHYSGLTNEQLLEYRHEEGREFATDTPQLRAHVAEKLRDAFSRGAWDDDQAEDVAAGAILEWIVARVEQQGVDIDLAPLSPKYLGWKDRSGYDTRIGIKSGSWLGALKSSGVVTVSA